MKKAFINWSSGKDAAFALYLTQQQKEYSVEKLLTTVNSEVDRISMHGLRSDLLLKQAQSIGIPLEVLPLAGNVSMTTYNKVMEEEMLKLKNSGFNYSIFGDIFLEDLKLYREQQLQKVEIEGVFPLWKKDTSALMKEILAAGFKAITVSVNAKFLDRSFCGRLVDESFLADLPSGVDPAGENGEFHIFVFDGPIFSHPVTFQKGQIVEKFFASAGDEEDDCFKKEKEAWDTKFYYCDLISI
ncbi:adenine nucleotide alpha hydrolase [Salinimicrobium sp. MT39]|uniref:Adenine nucleotide alpha hydrolase n=1 Tax=Salinimicrobium profundisediminis TaxID=2994553 RepID=A0A9X3CX36_9FLAO|nr:adenine nucleotide alpha hydrolase [Salinimicrobium profundisediminis]MCX2838300.1 adenine nucleotide alpha hydrolase [Salinimicrobium profundisediminis]